MKPQGGMKSIGGAKAKKKIVKAYKKLFDAFCETGGKQMNARMMALCMAGVLAQQKIKFSGNDQLVRLRGEFCFLMLDVQENGYLTFNELQWLLRAASMFHKPPEEVDKK